MFKCLEKSQIPTKATIAQTNLRGLLVNYYAPDLVCFQSTHLVHIVFSPIALIIFLFVCFMIKKTLIDSIITNSPFNETFLSNFDSLIMIMKTFLCVVFCFFETSDHSWLLSAIVLITSIGLLFSYTTARPHANVHIAIIYSFSLSLFLWSSIVVFIGKLFEFTQFDGCIPLFILGIPIIPLILLSDYKEPMTNLLINLASIRRSQAALEQIRLYLALVNQSGKNRQSKIMIKGYAHQHRDNCNLLLCPLKKYLESIEKGCESPAFLLQYAETLFLNAIAKFPQSFNLRIFYCKFLLQYLNKKQQVNQELMSYETQFTTFSSQFVLFHFRRLLEENYAGFNDEDSNSTISSSIVSHKYLGDFKGKINRIALLYFDFWTLILSNHKNPNQLTKLNDYSTRINKLVKELHGLFDTIEKFKINNKEALYYYALFFKDILNDKEKAALYERRYHQVDNQTQTQDENHSMFYDLAALTSSNEFQYIILSGSSPTFGLITNISLGVCSQLGYSKQELIGKPNEIILPEMFHEVHSPLLHEKVNEFKKEMTDMTKRINYKPSLKEINTFARSKAKYLVPFAAKVSIFSSEDESISFIAQLSRDSSNHSSALCYVITDTAFIIENFTVNGLNHLGLNSNAMNHSLELTLLIKQFYEEYLKMAVNIDGITQEHKIQLKKGIINKMFRSYLPVLWRGRHINNGFVNKRRSESIVSLTVDYQKFNDTLAHDCFLLKIEDINVRGHLLGYIFQFKKIDIKYYNALIKSKRSFNSIKDLSLIQEAMTENTQIDEVNFENYKSFIPEAKLNCILDTTSMSYILGHNRLHNLREIIKTKALEKIKFSFPSPEQGHSQTESESSSSCEKVSETEDEDSREDNSKSESYVESVVTGIITQTPDDYYRVNMDNIKYSVYSYEKKGLIEIPAYSKKSQVEARMFSLRELTEYNTKDIRRADSEGDKTKEKEVVVKDNQDALLVNQIEDALFKENNNSSIEDLRIIFFIIFFYFVLFGGAVLYVIIDSETYLNEGLQMLHFSSSLCYNALYAQFNVRDLVILSHENYTDSLFNNDKNRLKANLLAQINQTYHVSSQFIHDIITTFLPLSTNSSNFFQNETISLSLIRNLNVISYFSTLHEALIEVNTASYHIMTDLSTYLPTNNWVYFYIFNINNEFFVALTKQKDVFFKELGIVIFNYQIYLVITFSIGFTLMVGTFFLFAKGYDAIAKQKESYLAVFFEISLDIISASLEKCEKFIRKLQYDSFQEYGSFDQDNEGESVTKYTNMTNSNCKTKNAQTKFKEALLIKVAYSVFLIVIISIAIVIAFFFCSFLGKFNVYISLFDSQNNVNFEYLKLYRNMREYIFDIKSIIEGEISTKVFQQHINDFYSIINNKKDAVKEYKALSMSTIKEKYYSLEETPLWNTLKVNSTQVNHSFYSAPTYGLNAVLSNFIEEIRNIKNEKIRYQNNTLQFGYNLTLMGLDEYYECYPPNRDDYEEYFKYHPAEFLKSVSYQKIKMIFDFFVKPGFTFIFGSLITEVYTYYKTQVIFFFLLLAFYFIVILFSYLFIWRPFERRVHNTIFKTKNMLSIIPKEILGTLTNVKKLLNINHEDSKQKGNRFSA